MDKSDIKQFMTTVVMAFCAIWLGMSAIQSWYLHESLADCLTTWKTLSCR